MRQTRGELARARLRLISSVRSVGVGMNDKTIGGIEGVRTVGKAVDRDIKGNDYDLEEVGYAAAGALGSPSAT
jgi:hypothetical protein